MKYVRTRLGHEAVVLGEGDDRVTITREAQKVSNADADAYEKQAARVGVRLTITDADDDAAPPELPPGVTPTPDLSNGVAAVTGQGDPVTSAGDAGTDTAATGRAPRKDR